MIRLFRWIYQETHSYIVVTLSFVVVLLISAWIGWGMFSAIFVSNVDSYELGYVFDRRAGTTTPLPRTGMFIFPPIMYEVNTVDLRPMQVCISADIKVSQRVLNCKLVQFEPKGLQAFLALHGRDDYSIGTLSTFNEIMMIYAYDTSGRTYPFLRITTELKAVQVAGVEQP